MENAIKMNVIPENQLQLNGIKVLKENLGVTDTLKFLEQFDNGGSGDYTKEKYLQEDTLLSKEDLLNMFK